MRVLCLCILVFLGLASVLAIRSDDHGVLLETSVDKASMEMSLAVNKAVLNAQEALLQQVQKGVVLTDGQIDAAVKAAFDPIFSKCESITNAKEQRKCLINVAGAKKTTTKGCKAAACKKTNVTKPKVAKAAVNKTAVPKAAVVKKSKVEQDADKAKKHAAKAKEYKKKAEEHAKKAQKAEKQLKKDSKKQAKKAKKAAKKVHKQIAKAAPKKAPTAKSAKKAAKKAVDKVKKAKAILKKAEKKAKAAKKNATKAKKAEKKASFISEAEFAHHVLDAEAATESALDMSREGLVAFLEQSMLLEPSKDAAAHLETINVSMLDVSALEIPDINTNEIDNLLETAELHANTDAASLIESGVEVETEAEAEADAEVDAEGVDAAVHSLAEVESLLETKTATQNKATATATVDQTALSKTGVESHEALVAAAEAEMNRDLNAKKQDILDLSDLEDIPSL